MVLAVAPVMAEPGGRGYLGGGFEIQLDNDLALDHWGKPPLFVGVGEPLGLRTELRGLLRYDEESAGGLMTTELVSIRSDLTKLSLLSSGGRSSATTITSVSTVRALRADPQLTDQARKLLSFIDNRQAASLHARPPLP